MKSDIAVRCLGVSKAYRRFSRARKFQTLKSAILGGTLVSQMAESEVRQALHPLDLEVEKGEALGIIGANGSGKSTLLKLIYGTTKPTTGKVLRHGRISALIELGAGFHPEISGRENVMVNGIMLGLSRREIKERFHEIIAFSEMEDFIDAPVKTYSSGMYARLGFAVAISVRPDILIIDEVLSVGDEAFSHKCTERIRSFKGSGRTIILVTHDLSMVEKLCDRAVWLRKGRIAGDGDPRRVIDLYRIDVAEGEDRRLKQAAGKATDKEISEEAPETATKTLDEKRRWGSQEAVIERVRFLDGEGGEKRVFQSGEEMAIEMVVVPKKSLEDFVFGVGLFASDGTCVYGTNTQIDRCRPVELSKAATVIFRVPSLELADGVYQVDLAVHREDGTPYDYQQHLHSFQVRSPVSDIGIYRPRHTWEFRGGAEVSKSE